MGPVLMSGARSVVRRQQQQQQQQRRRQRQLLLLPPRLGCRCRCSCHSSSGGGRPTPTRCRLLGSAWRPSRSLPHGLDRQRHCRASSPPAVLVRPRPPRGAHWIRRHLCEGSTAAPDPVGQRWSRGGADGEHTAAAAEALRGVAASKGMTEVDGACVFPDEVDRELIDNHFIFRTLRDAGVLRCSYWLDDRRHRCWLIAEVTAKGGNINGSVFGGLTASLMDMGCGMIFSSNHRGATAYLNLQFTAPVEPLPATVLVRAELDTQRSRGRKHFITAELQSYTYMRSGHCLAPPPTAAAVAADADPPATCSLQAGPVCCVADALFVARRASAEPASIA
jgi:hypothetical protein